MFSNNTGPFNGVSFYVEQNAQQGASHLQDVKQLPLNKDLHHNKVANQTENDVLKDDVNVVQASDQPLLSLNEKIDATAQTGNVQKCRRLLQESAGYKLSSDAGSYLPILNIYIRNKDEKEAYAFFNEMTAKKVPLDRVTYTSLIELFVKKVDVKCAFIVFEEMKAKGMQPNEVTYHSLINLCIGNKDETRAFALFEEMKTRGMQLDTSTFNLLSDSVLRPFHGNW